MTASAIAKPAALLTAAQALVTERVLDQESQQREHLVIVLSGAHAYGFPSPDSDVDLKAVHIEPTAHLIGLSPPRLTFDRQEVVDGVEIDYTSNELAPVLAGLLGGNGNYLERVLGPGALREHPALASLRPLVEAQLSRRYFRHYHGFAGSQRAEAEKTPTVKKVLYVLRTALTGAHLLRSGRVETNLEQLAPAFAMPEVRALIEAKRAGEQTPLAEPERFASLMDRAFAHLDEARAASPLPEDPPNPDQLSEWLIALRKEKLS